jgi:hypothetical protein
MSPEVLRKTAENLKGRLVVSGPKYKPGILISI